MADQFKQNLTSIVNRISLDWRASTQASVALVLETGASSLNDLLAILEKKNVDLEILETVCWILARYEDKTATAILINTLDSQEPALRQRAANTLGLLANPDAVQPLSDRLFNDEDYSVRSTSAHALGILGCDEAIPHLLRALRNTEERPEVRGSAADALSCELGNEEVIQTLIWALQDSSAEVRFWSVFCLVVGCALPTTTH